MTLGAIVKEQTPEEREYTRYLAEVETRKRRAAHLQAELEELRVEIGHFEAEYHARAGTLFVELDRVRVAINEYERRIARLTAEPSADPRRVEEDVQREFAGRYEEIRQDDEETRRYERVFERDQERPRLDEAGEAEIVRLYRELARRFHPDLARTLEERHRREPLMQRINAAFQERNIAALRALQSEAAAEDPAFERWSIGEKLVWAIREVARLDGLVATLEDELTALRTADSFALWQRELNGEGVLERLERDLGRDIAAARDRLAELVATYRHLLDQTQR
ncbi:MAG: J domain-containing protein [Chloroflexota bacterium]|nr:J domain-containing protein [Chloroflexota bacterium]